MVAVFEPCVGLRYAVIDRGQDDIQDKEGDDIEALPDGRRIANEVWKWANMIRANGRRVDKVWLDLFEYTSHIRKIAEKGEEDWSSEACDKKHESSLMVSISIYPMLWSFGSIPVSGV